MGELSHPTTVKCLKQEYFPPPKGRYFPTLPLHQEDDFLNLQPQSLKDFYNSANEKPVHFKFPVSSNVVFVYNSPSEVPLSSIKKTFLSFVLWTCAWFTIRLHIPNCNYLLFLNKPIFVGGISGCLFEVHSTITKLPFLGTAIEW